MPAKSTAAEWGLQGELLGLHADAPGAGVPAHRGQTPLLRIRPFQH